VTNLTLAALLSAMTVGAGADRYDDAYHRSAETGQPIVVMVGAQWCGACRQMKQNTLPAVRSHGVLSEVSFAMVDLDEQGDLARQMIGSGPIPQLVMYRRTSQGWLRRKLVGVQSPEAVEAFIRRGIELNEAARRAEVTAQSASARGVVDLAGRDSG